MADKKPLNIYEESILRFMRATKSVMSPTEIARKIRIHPVTAQKNIKSLARKGALACKKVGSGKKRNHQVCEYNREWKF